VLRERARFFLSVLVGADLAIVTAAAAAAYALRFHVLSPLIPPRDASLGFLTHAIPIPLAAPVMLLAMQWAGLYRPRRDQRFHLEASAIVKATVVGVAVTVALLSLLQNVLFGGRHYSAWQFALFGATTAGMLLLWRFWFRQGLRFIRRRGWNLRHVAIIGTGRLGQLVCRTLRRNSWTGIDPAFFVSHLPATGRRECLGLEVKGGLADLERTLDSVQISGVFIALPGRMAAALPDLLPRLERYPLDVRIVPDMNPRYMPLNMSVNELEGMPILSLRESPLNGWGGIAKRAVDLIVGTLMLAVFTVPMLVIAFLVRLSGKGPVIFRQERMSLNGQRFKIFKFRTMRHMDAELQALRDAGRGSDAWTRKDDPRITRIGRFLRRTSLDELPQLLNVVLGEMSLVGPRPERPELIERFRDDWRGYMLRQNVKAGITGWAQVNGLRGDTSLRKRLQYDLFYIRNWSLAFDLRILGMTLFRGFAHANAH
jgi:Undecaprenyl-phosphate glucose phosphotransferase